MRHWPILILALIAGKAQAQEQVRMGIVGMVESVEPLIVAGRQIMRTEGVPVISILGPHQEVAQGDTLALVVRRSDGGLVAERILELYPVVGPVREVKGQTATIMGSAVHIPPGEEIQIGQWLAISGFWSGAKAITSNVRRFDGGIAQLVGIVDQGSGRLGESMISHPQAPPEGYGPNVWVFSGQPEGEGLRVRLASNGIFGRQVDLAVWQGYASLPIASQTYAIQGTGATGAARDAEMPTGGTLITRCVHDSRVVEIAPAGLDAAFKALDCARHTRAD